MRLSNFLSTKQEIINSYSYRFITKEELKKGKKCFYISPHNFVNPSPIEVEIIVLSDTLDGAAIMPSLEKSHAFYTKITCLFIRIK